MSGRSNGSGAHARLMKGVKGPMGRRPFTPTAPGPRLWSWTTAVGLQADVQRRSPEPLKGRRGQREGAEGSSDGYQWSGWASPRGAVKWWREGGHAVFFWGGRGGGCRFGPTRHMTMGHAQSAVRVPPACASDCAGHVSLSAHSAADTQVALVYV